MLWQSFNKHLSKQSVPLCRPQRNIQNNIDNGNMLKGNNTHFNGFFYFIFLAVKSTILQT